MIFTYHLSDPNLFSAASVEVWDRPLRLARKNLPVQKDGKIAWAPKKDPPETPSELLMDVVDPTVKGATISPVLIGETREGDNVGAKFPTQSFIVQEGADSADLTIRGELFGPVTHFLLSERESSNTWIAREYLIGVLADLQHSRVQIPGGYFSRSTILMLEPMPPGVVSPGSEVAPPWPAITIYVASRDRPLVSAVDPAEMSADSLSDGIAVRLLGSGFAPESKVIVKSDEGVLDFATITVFASPNELRVGIDPRELQGYSHLISEEIEFSVKNGDDLHVSDGKILHILPTATRPLRSNPIPTITSVSPYPVPLMDAHSPALMELEVYGENFREGQYLVLKNGDMQSVKIDPEYVSPNKFRAQIPRELWKVHRLSFRLVAQTSTGVCSVEVWEDE